MEVATWLLLAIGLLGAADILLFHTLAHGIRRHPDAKWELVTHALRGPTYAALFLAIPNLAFHGAAFWGLIALLLFDLGISIADFALEKESRRFLGGLSSGEYVLHALIAMFFGAFVAAVLYGSGGWAAAPSAVLWQPAEVPVALRLLLALMAAVVLYSGLADARAAWRMRDRPLRARPPSGPRTSRPGTESR